MVNSVPEGWIRPLLARRKARRTRHPSEFACAVRVIEGVVPGESSKWSYRRSAVDRLVVQDPDTLSPIITLTHGAGVRLTIRFTGSESPGAPPIQPHHKVWEAIETTTGAHIEVAADPFEADRLKIQ